MEAKVLADYKEVLVVQSKHDAKHAMSVAKVCIDYNMDDREYKVFAIGDRSKPGIKVTFDDIIDAMNDYSDTKMTEKDLIHNIEYNPASFGVAVLAMFKADTHKHIPDVPTTVLCIMSDAPIILFQLDEITEDELDEGPTLN